MKGEEEQYKKKSDFFIKKETKTNLKLSWFSKTYLTYKKSEKYFFNFLLWQYNFIIKNGGWEGEERNYGKHVLPHNKRNF